MHYEPTNEELGIAASRFAPLVILAAMLGPWLAFAAAFWLRRPGLLGLWIYGAVAFAPLQ
jgi:hypothetical protein